ncbi:MAG: DUF4421 domain-containing protein [Sphingobacteriia bacterium]|nr:MAG: DUF4421 domain-containing protein [Sphingobacteriia bacterium]
MKKWLFILVFSFLNHILFAQGLFKVDRSLPDSLFIKSFRNKLNLSTGTQLNNAEFFIANPTGKARISISPEITIQQFIKMEFRQINLRYTFSLFPVSDISDQPVHYRKEVGASFKIKQFNFDVSLQNSRGYYIKNSDDFTANTPNQGKVIQLPDLKTKVINLQASYNTNKQFSLDNIYSGRTLQIRKAFSFIPGAAIAYIHFFQENPVVAAGIGKDNYLVDVNFNFPVAATIAFAKKWYVSGIAGPMFGVAFYNSNTYNANLQLVSSNSTELTTGYYLRSGIGYTADRWYAGFAAYNQRYGSKSGINRDARFFYGANFYIGFRLKAPKVLKQTSDMLPFNDK